MASRITENPSIFSPDNDRVMISEFCRLDNYAAAPGHITFTAVDSDFSGHSVAITTGDYPGMVRTVKKASATTSCNNAVMGALSIIQELVGCGGAGCKCDARRALPAFIALMIKHPDKRHIKPIIRHVNASVESNVGVHVILFFFEDDRFAWMLHKPQGTVQ